MIKTKLIKSGFAISDLNKDKESDELLFLMTLLDSKVNEAYKRSHRVTRAFGAISKLKKVQEEKIRDEVFLQDRYYCTFKYKLKTTPLLLKLDKLVEDVEFEITSIKADLRGLRNKICKILHLNNKKS